MSHGPFSELSFECHKYLICGLPAPRCGDGVHRLLGTSGNSRQYLWIYYILTHRSSYTLLPEKLLPWVIDFVAMHCQAALPQACPDSPPRRRGSTRRSRGRRFVISPLQRLHVELAESLLGPQPARLPGDRMSEHGAREREGVVLAVLTAGIDPSGSD